jgi:hypothetical protein
LSISATAGGATVPTSGSYVYNTGTSVSIQANANNGYLFDHWELDDVNIGSTNPYTVTMDADHTLRAIFNQVKYTLTISTTTGGTTNPVPGTYTLNSGTSQSVLATAGTGYAFDHWMLDGANGGTANPISVMMNSDHILQAIFSVSTISLNVVAGTGGTVNPSGTQTLNIGQTYQFSATANSGYELDRWNINGQSMGSSNPLMLTATGAMNGQTLTALFTNLPTPTPTPTPSPSPTPPTSTPTPTPTLPPSPSDTPSPPPSTPRGTQGVFLPNEVIYAAVGLTVIAIIIAAAVVLKKRQNRTSKATISPPSHPPAKAEVPQQLETTKLTSALPPRVSVPLKAGKLPLICPKCLAETDLTTCALKWTKEKKKHQIDVPICKSCKKTLLGETRKRFAIYFAISAPICWGLAYFLGYLPQISWLGLLGLILTGENFVRLIVFFILLVLLLPVIIPLIFLYYTISPSGVVNWPVKLGKSNGSLNVFSFENEHYSKLFEAAKKSSTPSS